MNQFVTPAAPVNPTISIQPLTTAIPNHDATEAPNPLANLPVGTTVQGFVINRDPQSNPILRTSMGDLLIQSEVFIKTGSEVVFKIDAAQVTRARIISIDGLIPQDYAAQNVHGLTQDTISPSPLQNATITKPAAIPVLPPVSANTPVLPALVLQPLAATHTPAAEKEMIPPALQQLPPGTALKLTILRVEMPAAAISLTQLAETPLPVHLLPAAAPLAIPNNVSTASQNMAAPLLASSPPPPPLSPAAESPLASFIAVAEAGAPPSSALLKMQFQPQLVTVALANQIPIQSDDVPESKPVVALPSTKPESQPPLPELRATVIGHEADGANILQTKFATLKLYTPQPLPQGTHLTVHVELETQPPSAAPITPLSEEMQTVTNLSRDWQHLTEAINLLQTADPELVRHMPVVNHKLTSGLLFFLAAVKGGDLREWLGSKAISKLEALSPTLLSRLRTDMAQLQQFYVDSPLTNWSGVLLPMMFGNELQPARLYLRREDEGHNKQGRDRNGQRFIIEVDMVQLGELQFDGFIRQLDQAKNFDLIIRSARPLHSEISQTIRQIFENALQVTGLKGQLSYQQGAQYFIRPLADTPQKPQTILA